VRTGQLFHSLEQDARLVKETKIVVDGVPGDDLTFTVPASQGGAAVRRTEENQCPDTQLLAGCRGIEIEPKA
jgi:hypothetical protein